MSYADLLRDPRWQRRRVEILERDNRKCRECGMVEKLQVHHRWYEFGLQPWEYDDSALVTLCESCHERVTMATRKIKALQRMMSVQETETALAKIEAARKQPRPPVYNAMYIVEDEHGERWWISPFEKCDQHYGDRHWECLNLHPEITGIELSS